MENYFSRLKFILFPFLLLNLGTTSIYLLFYYIFILQLELNIPDKFVGLFLPMGLCLLGAVAFLRPRIKLLEIKNDRLPFFYYFIAAIMIFWTIMISRDYLVYKTNDVVQLTSFAQITKYPSERFYKINRYDIAEEYAGSTYTFERTGKNNKYLDLNIYFTAPIVESKRGSLAPENYKYWISVEYNDQLSGSATDAEINKAFTKLYSDSKINFFNRRYLGGLDHFERVFYNDLKVQTIKAIRQHYPENKLEDIVVLKPSKTDIAAEASNSLNWTIISLIAGTAVFSLIPALYGLKKSNRSKKRKKIDKEYKEFLLVLIPNKKYWATPIIAYITIVIFLFLVFKVDLSPLTGKDLIQFGGVRGAEVTTGGEVWRLFTSMFIHGSFMHLIYNLIALFLSGVFAESLFGSKRFLILYIVSGIAASTLSIIYNVDKISVGASGAIFGVFSALFTYGIFTKQIAILLYVGIYSGISLLIGLIIPGTDNAGHLGGVLCGALLYVIARICDPKIQQLEIPSDKTITKRIKV